LKLGYYGVDIVASDDNASVAAMRRLCNNNRDLSSRLEQCPDCFGPNGDLIFEFEKPLGHFVLTLMPKIQFPNCLHVVQVRSASLMFDSPIGLQTITNPGLPCNANAFHSEPSKESQGESSI
jgi:hypothetical protein